MQNYANKGEKTRKSNAKKRESQRRKNTKVKCEITLLKAKKREIQMRNNANKGEKTRKSNAK